MEKYDVIFTTEKNLDYIYVNRILEQKNLDDVRHKLRYIQQNMTSKREENNEKELVGLNQLFSIGNVMLVDFKIIPNSNKNIFKEAVNQVVSYVNSPNPAELANVLEKRFDETHLAIPETKMGLLHGLHKAVEKPLFQIFELEKEIQVVAMNNK